MKLKNVSFLSFAAFLIVLTLFSFGANAAVNNRNAMQNGRGIKSGLLAVESTDLSVSIVDTPDPARRGENVTYTITVANLTAAEAQTFTLRAFITNAATFVSFAAPAGFSCTTPSVGAFDPVNCSAPTVAGNSTNIFTLIVKVDQNAGIGASLYEPVDINAANDTDSENNSAVATTELTGGVFVLEAGGNYQRTNINTPFPENLRVRVTDGNEVPLPGVAVTFTAPAAGASGTFSNGSTSITLTTGQDGYATLVFTANGTVGNYIVTATAPDANSSVDFNLSNVAPMTFTVGNTNDSGPGSLREAIDAANNNSGDDTIVFDLAIFSTPQTITLTSGEISIEGNGSLTINGPGANRLTISGNNASRIFDIGGDNTVINDLKISNGLVTEDSGGAISSFGGTLQINRCAIYNNKAEAGGGISAFSTDLIINRSTFFGNQTGGGVNGNGGAIIAFAFEGSSTTTITNSTFNQNTATQGGAIYKGIPIFGGDPLQLNLTGVTIAGNTATDTGGGAYVVDGSFNVVNSIIAGNSSGDINGTITSQGYNLIQSTTNTIFESGSQVTDLIGINPLLAPLTLQGGTTETMALMEGSPAIDKGTSASVVIPTFSGKQKVKAAKRHQLAELVAPSAATDQRGVARPSDQPNIPNTGDGSDIGAFEMIGPTAAGTEISGRVFAANGKGLENTIVILTESNGQQRTVKTNSFGNFRFTDIPAGATYIVNINAKRYRFTPQIITPTADLQNLAFVPTE